MARTDEEIEHSQIASQIRGSMGGAIPPVTQQSRALVFEVTDENGNTVTKVKRSFNMGDPWTDDYYFRDWRLDE